MSIFVCVSKAHLAHIQLVEKKLMGFAFYGRYRLEK